MRGAISLDGPHWDNLIQALAHSLWQGALISLLLLLALRTINVRRPDFRYGLSCLALLAILSAAASTYGLLEFRNSLPAPAVAASTIDPVLDIETPEVPSANSTQTIRSTDGAARYSPRSLDWQRYIPAFWLVGVATMLFRALRLQWRAARIPSSSILVDDPAVIRMVRELAQTLRVSPSVRVLSTTALDTPAVVGWLAPAILLPAACLAGVPDTVLRAAIAHELAHIRRHDFLINQIQLMIEALLFFNPAVWWVSRQIRIEREAACDAIAARALGDELDYAKSLAAWATLGHGPAYALAATGQQRGSVLERVRRLLDARYTPALMRSWAGAAVLSVAGLAILAALTGGSYWGTFILARALTPEERIAVLEEVVAQEGVEEVQIDEYGSPRNVVSLRVRLKSVDGGVVPESAKVTGTVETQVGRSSRHNTSFYMERVKGGPEGEPVYEGKVCEGIAELRASAPGYAPAFAHSVKLSDVSPPEEIVMVLAPGFTSGLRLSGDDGAVLRNIAVTGTYDMGNVWKNFELVSDDEGVVRLEHCADVPVKWRINTPGYEAETKVMHPQKDIVAEWVLTAALPATGTVLDEKTGAPMAEARIYEVAREGGPNPGANSGVDSFPLMAQTDQQGRFTLGALRRDTRYSVMVESPKGSRALFKDVRAGDESLEFKVPSELSIRGTVRGALSRLSKMGDKPELQIRASYEVGESFYYGHSEQVPLEVEGDSATFVLERMWKGHWEIELPDTRMEFDITESRNDIDLVVPEEKVALTRDVILRLKGTNGVPPKGAIYVNYYKELGENWRGLVGPLAIEGEELRLKMIVPNTLSVNPDGMLGYGFANLDAEIPVGDDSFEIDIETWPAGSIQGTVIATEERTIGGATMSLAVVKPAPPLLQGHYRPSMENVTFPGDTVERFIATPVPLGGTYRLIASQGWNYMVGEEIRLDDRNPVVAASVTMPKGVPLRGRVLSESGEPLFGAQIRISMDLKDLGHYRRGEEVSSGRDGGFEFPAVNPDLPGIYSLEVSGLRHFQAVRLADVDVRDVVEVRLPVGIKVTGKVLKPDGSPAANVEVEAHRNGGFGFDLREKCKTDTEGGFEFSNLAGDSYQFMVGDRGQGWSAISKPVDVNTTRHVELRGEQEVKAVENDLATLFTDHPG